MPELPDVTVYAERIAAVVGAAGALAEFAVHGPSVLRTVEPAPAAFVGQHLVSARRVGGKRIAMGYDGGALVVVHLMIAGRLRWRPVQGGRVRRPPGGPRALLAAWHFEAGTLWLTESSTRKRAAVHCIADDAGLAQFDRGGIEPLECTFEGFVDALRRENRTLKRALTDPRLFAGIGNAYSDEILFAARLSPVTWTSRLAEHEIAILFASAREVLTDWTARLRAEVGDGFPETVTAFRPGMAVHGRYREPCRVCASPIQRIRYAANECNYCARCQTGGRLLADRGLSQLMRGGEWPRTLDELEELRGGARPP
ncbi:MAG: formamidopyrimidine-DNA glycosylase [Planctomycetes bacterium]|nr:formamidopyrimidine-DNA glycosylase [Planctomycetota bacterium]